MKINTTRVTAWIALCVVFLILFYFFVHSAVTAENRAAVAVLDSTILNQEKLIARLADATRVNGADSATERIIVDCKANERQRFDTLLDLLSANISQSELGELNTLFYKCGSFYADRKSVMATRLVREVEILSEHLTLRTSLNSSAPDEQKKVTAWQKLADAELKTAEYFNQLVILQGTIITQLNSGRKPTSPEVVATLNEVSSVRGQMLVLGTQIEGYKTEALAL